MNMDIIFNMYKIRFDTLLRLIESEGIVINNNDTVNVYINLEPILDTLLSANIEDYVAVHNDKMKNKISEFISNILNLAAHYRLFFSKHKIFSKIYLYITYPFKIPYKNNILIEDYRSYYKNKFGGVFNNRNTNEVIVNAVKYLKIMTQYIQNVYIVESGEIEGSLIPNIINKDSNDTNFIVTKDLYDYQYVNKNFYILRPKKDNNSYIISKQNVITTLQIENKSKNIINIDSEYIGFILAMLGDKKRSIPKIKNYGLSRILKSINDALTSGLLPKEVYNINVILSVMTEILKKPLLYNYNCIDIDTQCKFMNKKNEYEIQDQIKDRFDNVSLKKLNNEFFDLFPINLIELTSGDRFKPHKKQTVFTLGGEE